MLLRTAGRRCAGVQRQAGMPDAVPVLLSHQDAAEATMTTVVMSKSQPAPASLHVHLAAQLAQGAGQLIACTVCLEHTHCAPWVGAVEFGERLAKFRAQHQHTT